tara:strand:+ start:102 stop:416 length:315 start_codon:yes stop_codon:yes gene_type:complete
MGKGKLMTQLSKSQTEVNADRIASIHESSEVSYKRRIEDKELQIKNQKIDREALLDFSDKGDIIRSSRFDCGRLTNDDASISCEIRANELILEVLKERYKVLFE